MSSASTYWVSDSFLTGPPPRALCLGTGRFLRSVLVPLLQGDESSSPSILLQTRGTSFVEYMKQRPPSSPTYEVDTVLASGQVETQAIPCSAVFSLGRDKESVDTVLFPALLRPNCNDVYPIEIIGVGVTEHGLASPDTSAMQDLYQILVRLQKHHPKAQTQTQRTSTRKICVINTDNVPNNGDVLRSHMLHIATSDAPNDVNMVDFLTHSVAFMNTMVDRITSHRHNEPNVPRAEPTPTKALVILDEHDDLPAWFTRHQAQTASSTDCDSTTSGLIIRRTRAELDRDLALKLRIANGTHTALAHVLALCGYTQTDVLSDDKGKEISPLVWTLLNALVQHQIISAAEARFRLNDDTMDASTTAFAIGSVWDDWKQRLLHAHFGLSTFFITQNGAAKGGIRLGPTIVDLMQYATSATGTTSSPPVLHVNVAMAFTFAVLMRWLTPISSSSNRSSNSNDDPNAIIYTGWLNGHARQQVERQDESASVVTYADGLRYDLEAGWYEFRCACHVPVKDQNGDDHGAAAKSVSAWLAAASMTPQQPLAYAPIIRAYLVASTGGDLGRVADIPHLDGFVQAVATLYARLVAGDDVLALLQELQGRDVLNAGVGMFEEVDHSNVLSHGSPLHYRASTIPCDSALMQLAVPPETMAAVVVHEVAAAQVVDLHTHLLPPSHGSLCLWGIDELLTYHYLVAEYFMTAPVGMTPEMLYAKSKQEQADIIWTALFVERTPLSEATRGVVTTLVALGLSKELDARDLDAIRKFYSAFRDQGLEGTERFSRLAHATSGVRYNIMTNIPFDSNEAQHWRPNRKEYPEQYRSALRVDPLLAGDRRTVEAALRGSGYDVTMEGARQYLRDWCDVMKPEYMMASTPHDFVLVDSKPRNTSKLNTGVNLEAMKAVGAFADVAGSATACNDEDEDVPSVIDEHSDFLADVLMKVCEERDLPLALKIGAHRAVNPRLKQAGDGVVAFADAGVLGRLCARFPQVRFLATFLSRTNQHEACVLASKFSNLHLYGCWWYCFTPSIVKEITQMRIEMLGTAFTVQHSDARVLDQLIYKWSHSRTVIAQVLTHEMQKLCASGWKPTRAQIRRDVAQLFGGSYEDFMRKSRKQAAN